VAIQIKLGFGDRNRNNACHPRLAISDCLGRNRKICAQLGEIKEHTWPLWRDRQPNHC
jgi:hypothetical protein